MILPRDLQSLTFLSKFNQSLERVTFPNKLHILTFCEKFLGNFFDQSVKHLTLAEHLHSLSVGGSLVSRVQVARFEVGMVPGSKAYVGHEDLRIMSRFCGKFGGKWSLDKFLFLGRPLAASSPLTH